MTQDREPMTSGEFFEEMAAAMNCNSNERDRACFVAGVLAAAAIYRLDASHMDNIWCALERGWPSGIVHGAAGAMRQFISDHPKTADPS
jgi:hypothetical protein